jgi:membrane-bound lytic murein transglycosylase D
VLHTSAFSTETFTTPDNLRDNVDFWKKIYTEISLKRGIIHDREYPLIIYKTITIGDLKGRQRSRYIRRHVNQIKQWLKNILKKPQNQWTAKEEEIAALFRQYASMDGVKKAHKRIRFQQGQKERFKEGLERSGSYLPYILSVFTKYKIPPRIAFLPHVESSFNPRAYSRVGAAGMWQFMRRTGRLYLKVNYRVDERFDPFKATIAAAKLLRQNYSELKSWPLAITAYNHGKASMKRAVRVTGSRDLGVIIEKYKNRRFKFASKNFYGCFLAASEIAANPHKHFPNLRYHSPPKYNVIELKNYYRPKSLVNHLGIPEEQLKAMNPALRSIVFRRQLPIPRGYELRIPTSLPLEVAREKLGAAADAMKTNGTEAIHYYSVRRGDTLSRIARKFRVSTDSLIMINEISRENHVYIGQVLRIPARHETASSERKPVKKIETLKPEKTVKTGKKPAPTPSVPKKPEKLPSIETRTAEKFPKPVPNPFYIEKASTGSNKTPGNNNPSNRNHQDIFDATLYNLDVKELSQNRQAIITVSMGETLGHYADWLGTSVYRIRILNRGRRSINVNQKIRIPVKNTASLELFKDRRLEYHMAQEEDFYTNYKVVDTRERRIQYGDTLWSICNRDEVIPIWLLKKYNRDINLETLKVNMRLTIPVIAETGQ